MLSNRCIFTGAARFVSAAVSTSKAVCAALIAWAVLFVPVAQADTYPSRPIRIIVPFAPGGTASVMARLVGENLSRRLGQPVIIENKPGGGAIIGTDIVAKSEPDGYTLLLVASSHSTNPSLFSKLPYDTAKDFTPISLVASTPYMLLVHPTVPANSVAELVSYLKQRPDTINMSAGALGTPQHLGAELFKRATHVDVLLVPYKGSGAILPDLLAGRLSLAIENQAIIAKYVESGALRALAVTGTERSAAFPKVPTMLEAGVKDYVLTGWTAIVGPANMPPAIVQKLNTEIDAILREPAMRERLAGLGATPGGGSTADLHALFDKETAFWGKVIHDAGIRLD